MPAALRVSMHFRVVIIVFLAAIASSIGVTQTSSYFTPTDSMTVAHESSAAAELHSGTVLFAGARDGRSEVYDPQAGRFAPAGVSTIARAGAAALRLNDGRVLVVGGASESGAVPVAEFYDAFSGTFALAGELSVARIRPAVAKLRDGRVLIAGGHDGTAPLDSAELFDPATGTFVPAGRMSTARVGVATVLTDGTVLVTGAEVNTASASAEVFDPASGEFRPTGTLNVARRSHAVTPLPDGRALVSGGLDDREGAVAAAEIYDPASGRFEFSGSLKSARYDHAAVLLSDGTVFVVGGRDGTGPLSSTEIYDSRSETFSVDAYMLEARVAPVVVPLSDGGALVAGGSREDSELTTAERYWRQDKRQDTSITLMSSAATSTYGQPVTYTSTVTSADGIPAGAVRFLLDGAPLGQATLDRGRAELTTSAIPAGTRAVRAVYDGSSAFKRSESTAIQQVVAKAAAIGSFTISPIQRQYSDPVTFTATISPATAARSVTFKLGTTVIGEAEIVAGKATLVTPVTPAMPLGSRIITAVFNQDAPNYTISNILKSMSLIKEDARVVQYGGTTTYTACPSCTTAKVLLRATVKDISATAEANGDTSPGDIRNATFTFINRSSYGGIATVPVTVSDLADPRTGEAVYEWAVDLGSAASKSFKIGYSVGGLYTYHTYDYVTVTVARPKQ